MESNCSTAKGRTSVESNCGKRKDLADVVIPAGLSVQERVASLAQQLGNPYEFDCYGTHVRIAFAGEVPVETALARFLGVPDR